MAAFFLQGTKTLAYELWERPRLRAGQRHIPTGAGSNVLGCDIGFGELCAAAESRLRGCSPSSR